MYNIIQEVNMKVLVVDDEKLIRDVIKEYLVNEDYTVVEAENGEEAVEICNKEIQKQSNQLGNVAIY